MGIGYKQLKWISFLPLFPSFGYPSLSFLHLTTPPSLSFRWLPLLCGCNVFYFHIGSDEVLLKIMLESLMHIKTFNSMEINLLS